MYGRSQAVAGGSSTRLARLVRLAWPYGNVLARGSDRVESAALVCCVLAALLLAPVMLALGSAVHADMVAAGEQQARTRQPAVAVLTEDAPPDAGARGGESRVPATWTLPDGTTGSGRVPAGAGLPAGTKVDIWLDTEGRVVDTPLTASDAAVGGATVTLSGWLTAVVLLVAGQSGLQCWLNRRRYREWDRQWARVEPGWNDYRR